MDNLLGLPANVRKELLAVTDIPLKGNALRSYNSCIQTIVPLIANRKITIS
jgi:hypothetical protein